MKNLKELTPFTRNLWLSVILSIFTGIIFASYVWSEKQIDVANDLRHESLLLANELRQSSEDLTRMARIYAVTANPIHKQYFQDILDIRDGKKPRPEEYEKPYWLLVLANNKPPRPDSNITISYSDLIRQKKFTKEEIQKLEDAKSQSDTLSIREAEAIRLVNSTAPSPEVNRAKARTLLHDQEFFKSKAIIMKSISDFYAMVDKRTKNIVLTNERNATVMRIVFILSGLGFFFMIGQTYHSLRKVLGGSLDMVHSKIAEIGSGNFISDTAIETVPENSILKGLLLMQNTLRAANIERSQAEELIRENEKFLHLLTDSIPGMVGYWTKDLRCKFANKHYQDWFGKTKEQMQGIKVVDLLGEDLYAKNFPFIQKALNGEAVEFERTLTKVDGKICYTLANYIPDTDSKTGITNGFLVTVTDITEIKKAQLELQRINEEQEMIIGERTKELIADITKREQADQNLSDLKLALDDHAIAAITDKYGIITYANHKFCEISKYSLEELIGQNHQILNSGYHPKEFFQELWKTIRNKNVWKGEIKNKAKDGSFYWVQTTITPALDSTGEITQYIVIRTDITANKHTEEILLISQQRLAVAARAGNIGIWDWNILTNELLWDESMYIQYGISKEDFGGAYESWAGTLHPDERPAIEEEIQFALRGEKEYAPIHRIIRPDGTIRIIKAASKTYFDKNKTPVRMIGTCSDITDIKSMEHEIRISQQRLRAFMDAATDNFSIYDSELTIVDLNEICLTWLPGKSREDIIGKNLLDIIPGLKGTENFKNYQNVIQTGEAFIIENVLMVIQDLGKRYISVKAFRVGEGMGLILTDVTDQNKLQEELRQAKEYADSANRAKSEFLASMSHEIRTPLNGVIGFTDLILKTKLNDTQTQYMDIVYKSANSLLDLINDTLDFSKIEAGKLDLHIEKVDLFELVGQVTDVIKYKASENNLEILLNVSQSLPRFIYADPMRLRQILINLLGNAIKFTKKGEIEVKIELMESKKDNTGLQEALLLFSVRDTGIGISKENQQRIFEAFSQEDSSTTRNYGGTGLGLSISNKLLGLMNSKLELESERGIGSKFYFTLTLKVEEGNRQQWMGLEAIKNVLIVDDNQNNRTILQEMLAIHKIKSDAVANGFDALLLLEENDHYDLLITDYDMPVINGIELIRRTRARDSVFAKELPIILLHSAYSNEALDLVCKELEVKQKIQKPIKINELLKALTRLKKKKNETDFPEHIASSRSKHFITSQTAKILIVDDVDVNLLLLRTILSQLIPNGIIIEAGNGKQAIEQCIKEKPDIIFMDVQMPEMNGYEATLEIRKLENGKRVPIIALTAGTIKEEIEKCFDSGMDDFASKPIIQDTFGKIIEKWLGSSIPIDRQNELLTQDENTSHFNFVELKARLGIDKKFLVKILGMANTTLESSIIDLKNSLANKDFMTIHAVAHKIKGTSLTMCCNGLAKLAAELENKKDFDEQMVSAILQKMELEVELVRGLIVKELEI